jgi:hypothetical protein
MSLRVIIVLAVLVAILAAVALRSRGPRVTQIDRTVRRKKEGEGQ